MPKPTSKYVPSAEEIEKQQELLAAHRQTLAIYLRQRALHGEAYTPPSIIHGIHHAREAIQQSKATLRSWNIEVKDHPDDAEPPEVLFLRKLRRIGFYAVLVILAGSGIFLGNRSWPCLVGAQPALASIQATAEPTVTNTPEPTIPSGFTPLAQKTSAGWTPGDGQLTLVSGTLYRYDSERVGNWCRIALLPDTLGNTAQPWVNCRDIGEPEPTKRPTSRPRPTAIAPTQARKPPIVQPTQVSPPPPPPVGFTGVWAGKTDQGRAISFKVVPDPISEAVVNLSVSFQFDVPCPIGQVTFTSIEDAHIFDSPGNSFSFLGLQDKEARASLRGAFASNTTASGILEVADWRNARDRLDQACPFSTTIKWSVAKQ